MDYSKEFKDLCQQNGIEPVRDKNGRLQLICPRYPSQDVQDKIKSLSQDPTAEFVPALRTNTRALIGVLLAQFGVTGLSFIYDSQGTVVLDVEGEDRTALQPSNPGVWGKVCYMLVTDPYTKHFMIQFNGKPIIASDPPEYLRNDMADSGDPTDEEAMNAATEKVQARFGNTPQIKDDRFDYDKDFLPQDIGTDVRILAESTNSVEDFLKSIGGV